jgi:hypothetical protein
MKFSRRDFIKTAAAMGASLAWVGGARASRVNWSERRDLYPEGVASGDPDARTRRSIASSRKPRRRFLRHPIGRAECSSPGSSLRGSIGIGSPTLKAAAAA